MKSPMLMPNDIFEYSNCMMNRKMVRENEEVDFSTMELATVG